MRHTHPQTLLLIAGEGPALRHLERLAGDLGLADHVRFVGYLSRQQALPDCYAAGDVFTFASRTETADMDRESA